MKVSLSLYTDWWAFEAAVLVDEWNKPMRRNGAVWVCAACGEAWAKASVADAPFIPVYSICEHCSAEGTVLTPGSLLTQGLHPNLDDSYPPEVWQRELEIHIRHAEKEAL